MKKIIASVMPVGSVPMDDAKKFITWMWKAKEQTNFDQDALSYPRSCMTMAQQDGETVMMIPLHPVLMFESMVKKEGLSDRQAALGMYRIGEVVESVAKDTGHGEAYFITNDAREVHTTSRHGWTVVMHDADRGVWLLKRKVGAPTGRTDG